MSRPAIDVDMLIEMQVYLKEIQDGIIKPETNALVNTRIYMKKNHRMAEVVKIQKRIKYLQGLTNKNINFQKFVRHYLDLKSEDRKKNEPHN